MPDLSLNFKYASAIVPNIPNREYTALIKKYEEVGKLPKVLKIQGVAVDSSLNGNNWRIRKKDLESIAKQLKGAQIRKDHSDTVDSIIGRVNNAWLSEEGDDAKVLFEGEVLDEGLIPKVLLGYVKFNSIQVASNDIYCANCLDNKVVSKEEEAKLSETETTCPRCGKSIYEIRNPQVIEQSFVSLPAYSSAVVTPIGFKAALDSAIEKFKSKSLNIKSNEAIQEQRTPNSGYSNFSAKENMSSSTVAPSGEFRESSNLSYDKILSKLESIASHLVDQSAAINKLAQAMESAYAFSITTGTHDSLTKASKKAALEARRKELKRRYTLVARQLKKLEEEDEEEDEDEDEDEARKKEEEDEDEDEVRSRKKEARRKEEEDEDEDEARKKEEEDEDEARKKEEEDEDEEEARKKEEEEVKKVIASIEQIKKRIAEAKRKRAEADMIVSGTGRVGEVSPETKNALNPDIEKYLTPPSNADLSPTTREILQAMQGWQKRPFVG